MTGFGLLIGHLVGDYIVQNDWMAANKVNALAGKFPGEVREIEQGVYRTFGDEAEIESWCDRRVLSRRGHLACTVHCLLYTLAVWACSWWWMPWWGLAVVFGLHWPIDRFRLARWWMVNVSGQTAFATGPLSPWSIIIVDNVFHLATLFAVGLASGVRT